MSTADRRKWDQKWAGGARVTEPAGFLLAHAERLPRRGRALDLAGGPGRHAIWLANRGLDVTLADVSPVALQHAQAWANQGGLALTTLELDLEPEHGPLAAPPAGPWGLVLCHHFLYPPLLGWAVTALTPGGLVVLVQPTLTNLERHARPGRRFLLEPGQLEASIPPELEVVVFEEDWRDDRHEARLIAKRPDESTPAR